MPTKRVVLSVSIFFLFALLFISLRSHVLTAIDGNTRSITVYESGQPFLHANNHALYPVHVYFFNKLLALFKIRAETPFQFFQHTAALNALSGAAALVIFFLLLETWTGSLVLALLGTFWLGFSHAFSLNATNANEAMPGLLLSLVALFLFSKSLLSDKREWMVVPAGILLAYAFATYQSMVLLAPGMILLLIGCALLNPTKRKRYIRSICSFIISFGTGIGLIYGFFYTVYLSSGNYFEHFFGLKHISPFEMWLGFRWEKIFLTVLGFFKSLFGVQFGFPHKTPFEILAHIWENPVQYLGLISLIVCWTFATCLLMWDAVTKIKHGSEAFKKPAATLALLCFPLLIVPYFQPLYMKTWLQPITGIIAFLLLVISTSESSSGGRKIRVLLLTLLVLGTAFWNLKATLIPNHLGNAEIDYAIEDLDHRIERDSLVVIHWDPVGLAFASFYPAERTFFNIQSQAVADSKQTALLLEEQVKFALENKRPVYFVGLLDLTPDMWNSFLGDRAQLDFHALDVFRKSAKALRMYQVGNESVTLHRILLRSELAPQLPAFGPSKAL